MKNLYIIFVMIPFVLMSACKTTPKPGTPEAKALVQQNIEVKQVAAAEQIVSNLPDWCSNVPSSDFAHYACGIGESSNLNMSRSRATLDGKRQLADMIDSEISSRMEDFLKSVGTGGNEQIQQASEIITKNVTVEAKLTGYKQKQSETQNVGTKYIHYILLEYPVGPANQALVNQIKQNEVLSTQKAADEALAELEAEINKKRTN